MLSIVWTKYMITLWTASQVVKVYNKNMMGELFTHYLLQSVTAQIIARYSTEFHRIEIKNHLLVTS